MRFIKVEWDPRLPGFRVDPTAYLSELPRLRGGLPSGAWEFASESGHYSFRSPRCVKDLELVNIFISVQKAGHLVMQFAPNEWKHDSGLRIEYFGVTHFSIDRDRSIDWMESETVILDETLPAPEGCLHQIAMASSSIEVRCSDLRAVWGE